MTRPSTSRLLQFYRQYLESENSADFMLAVSKNYAIPTLHRMAIGGDCLVRRAAMLAIAFLGGRESFEAIGYGLRDTDRAVRMLAEDGSRKVWRRAAPIGAQRVLQRATRFLECGQFAAAIESCNELIRAYSDYAEAFNQRAICFYAQNQIDESIADCQRVLELNPHHFPSATGLGHCFMEKGDIDQAIAFFHYALQVCPDLECVRAQIRMLKRSHEL